MKIITTVGASIFSNSERSDERLENTTYNKKYFQEEQLERIGKTVKRMIRDLTDWTTKNSSNTSAEIASILKIQAEYGQNMPLDLYLICTETIFSRLAAEVIKNFFEQKNANGEKVYSTISIIHIKVVENLRVDNQANYDDGFSNLIQYLSEIGHQEGDLLNITGGYKALVPILTLYGQLEKLNLKYIYDESCLKDAQLIEWGQLPIHFDSTIMDIYGDYLSSKNKEFKQLQKVNLKDNDDLMLIIKNLRSLKLLKKDCIELTPLGQLFKNTYKNHKTKNKGDLGGFIELKICEELNKDPNYSLIKRSKYYYWDKRNPIKWSNVPLYGNEHNKELEIPLEIDIEILQSDATIIWSEVKALSNNGLNKAFKQIKLRLEFLDSIKTMNVKEFHLYLYRIPRICVLNNYKSQLHNIIKLFENKEIELCIKYLDLPMNKGTVNWNIFDKQTIIFNDYNF